ncbi:hypothetical protein M422DRAFT_248153 [Sphaerobolus stellatus SS14]|uniref:Uncharacterized protein n=1 Tax=Sphaerobolus stellatus (strain SS14) TaxID=990650 RepID=A0A0C9W4V6_SPHS4|nr:hypothetical protein M422DRAFT_248153 [Sphaerobolus stellatus SS14]
MPRAVRTPKPPSTKKSGRKQAKNAKPNEGITSIVDLIQLKDDSLLQYGLAKSTIEKYTLRLSQGEAWLKDQVELEKKNTDQCQSRPWTQDQLKNTFDITPNATSAQVLSLFIAHMCFNIDLGKSTGEQIHAAFKWWWSQNPKCRGMWAWNDESGKWTGNPATDLEVTRMIRAVRSKHASDGERMHSAPMTKDYLDRIMGWSYSQCPPTMLDQIVTLEEFHKVKYVISKHLWMRAFMSGSFTLWARFFEMVKLQKKHYRINLVTPDDVKWNYDECHLENRKGWNSHVRDGGKMPTNRYEIHPQPEEPSMDMHTHMRNWIGFLEKYIFGRALQGDDFLFPPINSSGLIQLGTTASHDLFQIWLNEFVQGAGIDQGNTKLTTHCFRRGGAQYRFQFAPVGKRWNLATVKWWGGWSEGEKQDTLIKYLLDDLHNYEEGHGDALRPYRREKEVSLLAEHQDVQSMPRGEFMQFMQYSFQPSIIAAMEQTLDSKLSSWTSAPTAFSPVPVSLSTQRAGEHNPSASTSHLPPSSQFTLPVQNAHTDEETLPYTLTIPTIKRSKDAWKRVIKDWENGDAARGLDKPLKDWSAAWIKHSRKAQLYANRKMIAEEYINRYHHDDAAFILAYPMASDGINPLVEAIRARHAKDGLLKTRNSKYGTPEERAAARGK